MKRSLLVCAAMIAQLPVTAFPASAQDKMPLRLVQSIPMPNVKGRIDHMDVDIQGMRLFVAGLENGSLEVVDLRAGRVAQTPAVENEFGCPTCRICTWLFDSVYPGNKGMGGRK